MDPNELVKPCQICNSPVHEKLMPGAPRYGGASGPPMVRRVCQNAQCPSNTGVGLRYMQGV